MFLRGSKSFDDGKGTRENSHINLPRRSYSYIFLIWNNGKFADSASQFIMIWF